MLVLLEMMFVFMLTLAPVYSISVSISNAVPRRDVTGKIMDAHDSKLLFYDGLYHWFAASYGDCLEPANTPDGCADVGIGNCGFQTDHNVTLFTSPDLVTWTDRGVVFGAAGKLPPNSVLFAPKTVLNPKTNQFVMWFNYIVGSFSASYYGVATSDTATGPFTLQVAQVNTTQYQDNGDESVFVDDDGQGYFIYTSLSKGHMVSVERMTPDYLGTMGAAASSGVIGSSFVEAPMMFKRNGIYYVVFGGCCCYCGGGSVTTVYTASNPLGPYTARNPLGQLESQSTDIFGYTDEQGVTQFMYVGDHWQSAPDGVKGHDFTVWAPLVFSDDGLTVTATYQDQFKVTVNVSTPGNADYSNVV